MAEVFPTPEEITPADADALGGTVDERTGIRCLIKGQAIGASPTLAQLYNQDWFKLQRALAAICAGMAVKTDTLEIGVYPLRYTKQDGTRAFFEGDASVALTASQTNSVYILHATNAVVVSIAGFPVDVATFTPIAEYVCGASDITTPDAEACRRGWELYRTHALGSSPTGTTGTTFTTDDDNAGAGVDGGYRHNRGTSGDAEDAEVRWIEASALWRFLAKHTAGTLAPIDVLSLMVGGAEVIDSSGDLAAAAIKTTLLYVFGANGATAYGIRLTLMGSAGAPAAGAHAAGELAADVDGNLYICLVAGTPGTWILVGKQDGRVVLSIGNGSASAGNAATCSIQAKDGAGQDLAVAALFDVYLMDDTDGAADAPNCSDFAVTVGTLVRTLVAQKSYRVKADATGLATFTVKNSIADAVYVLAAAAPGGALVDVSDRGTLSWT